ncbi:hypothetical protein [Micromonospora endolithica]|uniref:Uncharacterized protein n=1 Tax=Micromonospora endolithica TaxID=230091 RepID=A0A3A9Z2C3_9ACTN|nr:hypothetical protein [Micromonospora endolithica]RKN41507.1 hypothetical protein D7223_24585 [Micromonospora endolithica]TWJ21949.1 hypothetical protein JD76_02063 [Micromonospora endolithica]
MAAEDRNRTPARRWLLWSGILALAGLVLLVVGLTVADGVAAWIEVTLAIVLLLASYGVQYLARRESLYADDQPR